MDKFLQVRKLVDDRELDPNNLFTAQQLLEEMNSANPDPKYFGLLCEIKYLEGEIAPKKDKINIYKEGIEYGKKGVELDKENLESNFWLSVNFGLLGDNQGMMNSIFLLEPIEFHLNKAIQIDESYFYGAPLRVLGYFYHKIPGWPISKGDNKKAKNILLKALRHGPIFFLNHLYIAKIYKSLGEKKKAKEHLRWIMDADLTTRFAIENGRIKKEAEELLKII